MPSTLTRSVESLMRTVATEIVMPRFRNLAAHEIQEKADAHDLVTIADKESEERLSEGLAALLPEAGIVGEEATAADPRLLDGAGQGLVWIIDPIDGTGNFAAGRSPFALMVALADHGIIQGGWILDPVTGRFCHAEKGQGAAIDGVPVRAQASGLERPIAALAVYFMTPEMRADIAQRSQGKLDLVDIPRCAGEQYPRLVLGQNDISVFERSLPWDHAAGALILNEAGGRLLRQDGSDYVVGDAKRGLLGASSPRLWDEAAAILFG